MRASRFRFRRIGRIVLFYLAMRILILLSFEVNKSRKQLGACSVLHSTFKRLN